MAEPPIDMPKLDISASDLAVIAGKSKWAHPWTLLEPMLRKINPDRHSVFVRKHPMAPSDPNLRDYLKTCQEPLKSLVSEYVGEASTYARTPQLTADQIEALPGWIARQGLPAGQRDTLSRLMADEIRCAYGKIAEDSYVTLLESCPMFPDTTWQRSELKRACVIKFHLTDFEVQLWGTPDMLSRDSSVVVEVKSRIGTRLKPEATARALVQTDAYLWTHDARTAYLAEFVYEDTAYNEMTMLRWGKVIDSCKIRPVGSSQIYTVGSTQVTCRTRADADAAFRDLYGPKLLAFCKVFDAFANEDAWQASFAKAVDKVVWYEQACKCFL